MPEAKFRILFTSPILRHPPIGGPQLRIENSVKALSKISDLYIYSRVSLKTIGGHEGLAFFEQYCKGFFFAPSVSKQTKYIRFAKRCLNLLFKNIIHRKLFSLEANSDKDFKTLVRTADEHEVDVIWLGYGNISYPLLDYLKSRSNYKVVVDTDSVWSRFVLRGLPFAKNENERQRIEFEGNLKAEEERRGTPLADVTTAVSEIDAGYYRGLAKYPQQIQVFSNVVDVQSYRQIPEPAENLIKPCIFLAGSFGHGSPMEVAARWTVENVLPLVRRQIPDLHLYIIGWRSDKVLADIKDPAVTVTGTLPSVLPYLCHADVSIVPLKFESGTRFKILESGAVGIPVVSTTLGAEGLPVTHGKNILIADSPEGFANSIIQLVNEKDFAGTIGFNCQQLVKARFSVEYHAREAEKIIERLAHND